MNYRNHEHYADPTAALAVGRAQAARGAGPREKRKEAGKQKADKKAPGGPREGWEALASAVVLDAVGEYREARAQLRYPARRKAAAAVIRRLEQFFRSPWFASLTEVDGEALIDRLRRENE